LPKKERLPVRERPRLVEKAGARTNRPHKQVAVCCLNITLIDGKLLLRNRAATICNGLSGQMEAIMRANILIGTLAVLAISAGIYAANTQIERASPGYRWAEQRGIDDRDSSGVANEADNGIGTPRPLSPDEDDN
jgi:hypothetical protein